MKKIIITKEQLDEAINKAGGNIRNVSEAFKMSRDIVYKFIKEHDSQGVVDEARVDLTERGRLVLREMFIENATNLHNNFYSYVDVKYKNNKIDVRIICPKHGAFMQTPNTHLEGRGCNKCGRDRTLKALRNKPNTFSHSEWCKMSDEADGSPKVYIIKIWNDEEVFYKVGKTFKTVTERFKGGRLPYDYVVIDVIEGSGPHISKLEVEMQKINEDNRYVPKIKFGGMYECFTKIKGYGKD